MDGELNLEPCPFCGETPGDPVDATRILGVWNLIHRCNVLGPVKIQSSDRETVIARWNTRAARSERAWVTLPLSAVEVIQAARNMPRRTPAPGGCSTVHDFKIEAGTVWAMDRALDEFDKDSAVYGAALHKKDESR